MQSTYIGGLKFILFVLLFMSNLAYGEYTVNEILFIPWGERPSELDIAEAYREYNEGPEADTIGFLAPEGGPDFGFVDRDENVYFISYSLYYLKGFDLTGNVIVDYSQGKTQFNDDFFSGMFINFYVDSLGRIYCGGDEMFKPYVAVVDRNNNLLDRLNPLGVESGIGCTLLDWGSDDVLTFLSLEGGQYTYRNGQFYAGGSMYWRAGDGYYYDAKFQDSSAFAFIKAENPDTSERFESADSTLIQYSSNDLSLTDLIGVDDSFRFYVKCWDSSDSAKSVQVFNYNYTLLDEFSLLPRQSNRFLWYIDKLFLRHDGNIYEFHCRDDGMHVFRWSRQ